MSSAKEPAFFSCVTNGAGLALGSPIPAAIVAIIPQ
jgi:hypothetical protein